MAEAGALAIELRQMRERQQLAANTALGFAQMDERHEALIKVACEDVPRLLDLAEKLAALHAMQDRPVICWDHICDAHRGERGMPVHPLLRDCPDCRFHEMWVCSHCECPNDEWECPTVQIIIKAVIGEEK
jgi:hypothetical protein